MLDLQNLRELILSPFFAISALPNLPLLLKFKMAAIAFARPQNTPALQANTGNIAESLYKKRFLLLLPLVRFTIFSIRLVHGHIRVNDKLKLKPEILKDVSVTAHLR